MYREMNGDSLPTVSKNAPFNYEYAWDPRDGEGKVEVHSLWRVSRGFYSGFIFL